MDFLKLFHVSLICSVFGLFFMVVAQDSPEDYLRIHNTARAGVGVPPLVWDETLAAYARQYANRLANNCELQHSSGPYGENLQFGSADISGAAVVQIWVDEKQYYNYNTNSCAPRSLCGHYTQVVWRSSKKVGCAKVECRNGYFITGCNYDPKGNNGERPY